MGQAEPRSGSCLGIPGILLVCPVGGCLPCGEAVGVLRTEHGLDTDAVMQRVILCREVWLSSSIPRLGKEPTTFSLLCDPEEATSHL